MCTYGASLMAQMVKNLPAVRRPVFDSWIGKIPWRRQWQLTSVFLPGKSDGQRSRAGYSPRVRKEVGEDLVTKQYSNV